MSSLF